MGFRKDGTYIVLASTLKTSNTFERSTVRGLPEELRTFSEVPLICQLDSSGLGTGGSVAHVYCAVPLRSFIVTLLTISTSTSVLSLFCGRQTFTSISRSL